MKVTNREVIEAKGAIDKLLQEKLPVKTAWGIAQIAKKLSDALAPFGLIRDGLFSKYEIQREQDKETNELRLTSKNGTLEKFSEEFNELLLQETEIVFTKVKLPDTLVIEPSTLVNLINFIEVP